MRKIFLATALFLIWAYNGHAQAGSKAQAAVQATVTNFFEALAVLDTEKMTQYITSDFVVLEDGAVWNRDTLARKVEPLRGAAFSRKNKIDFIRTTVNGTTAWVAYTNAADMTLNGQALHRHWLESAYLIKKGDRWKIALLHSTSVQPVTN